MSAWGAGLYSSDFAKDLKPVIAALARLPKSADELLAILVERFGGVAKDADDEDHSTFWLVVADQFAKLGLHSLEARQRALAIIDEGGDLVMMKSLDMSAANLKKRKAMLDKLRPSIASPPIRERSAPLKAPQPFIMALGDCYAFPTSKGDGINPYMGDRTKNPGFAQDGWGAGVIAESGRAFGYLAWYRFAVIARRFEERPSLSDILSEPFGNGLGAGTCSPLHFKRLELQKIGALSVDPAKLHRLVPELTQARSGDVNAMLDVSMANNMYAQRYSTFIGPKLADILA